MQMVRILLFALFLSSHPVHVTLLSIDYTADDHSFNAFLKVYFDDFLLDYKLCLPEADKPEPGVSPDKAKELIRLYINKRISFIAGKKKIDADLTEMTLSENELRMTLRYAMKKKCSDYSIENNILTDIYKDQTNLLIFRYDKYEEGIRLTAENKGHVFHVD